MDVPVCEKYTLTLREAAAYFSIGEKKIRRQYSFYLRKVVDITGGQSDIYDRRRKNI